ncbi:MAG: hypothetical protein ACREQA_14155, partial [Candidatus Binatia bacterium]
GHPSPRYARNRRLQISDLQLFAIPKGWPAINLHVPVPTDAGLASLEPPQPPSGGVLLEARRRPILTQRG